MPLFIPPELDAIEPDESGTRPAGGIVGLGGNNMSGLSASKIRAELANRGQRILEENDAALELARTRRRGKNNGTSNFTPSQSTSRSTSDNADVRPNRFQRGNPLGRLR